MRIWRIAVRGLTGVGLGALAGYLAALAPLPGLDRWFGDQAFRLTPAVPAVTVLVTIDEEDLKLYGQWPWPRDRMAEAVTRLTQAGAGAIGITVVFAEADRMKTPENDTDGKLAGAIRKAPVVLGTLLSAKGVDDPPRHNIVRVQNPDIGGLAPMPPRIPNLPELEQSALVGPTELVPDEDGVVRVHYLLRRAGREIVPSFESLIVTRLLGCRMVMVRPGGLDGLEYAPCATNTQVRLPLSGLGSLPLARQDGRNPVVPFHKVLAGEIPPDIAGKPVLIIAVAAGLTQLVATRQGVATAGEVTAQTLDTLLAGGGEVLPRIYGLEMLAGLLPLLLVWVGWRVWPVWLAAGVAVSAALVGAVLAGVFVSPVPFILALLLTFAAPRWRLR